MAMPKGFKHSVETRMKIKKAKSGKGNYWYGKKLSKKHRAKIVASTSGSKNHGWLGDKVGYLALHVWIRKNKPMPLTCEICKRRKRLEIANISQKYLRDVNDFEWLCRRCHFTKDGRIEKFEKARMLLKRDCRGRYTKSNRRRS